VDPDARRRRRRLIGRAAGALDEAAYHRHMSHGLWPLYDLRVRTSRLELRLPTEVELVALAGIARAGIHEDAEMPFSTPWTRLPSPEFEWGFMQYHWRARGEWVPEHWTLELAAFVDDAPIGMQAVLAGDFPRLRTVRTGSWLGMTSRGHGLGKEMRAAILALAFDGLSAEVAETEAFADNAASLGVSHALGYEENGMSRMAPMGVARETTRFRLTRERWLRVRAERALPHVTIAGLEPCLPLFGLG
jgi:RimJ/RimL family protein N-acetyltransferase